MLPETLHNRLSLPAMAAPMFLVSGVDLVVEPCRAGMSGTFPSFNHRTPEGYGQWLGDIRSRLSTSDAPFGVQLSIHYTNRRLHADLALTIQTRSARPTTSTSIFDRNESLATFSERRTPAFAGR